MVIKIMKQDRKTTDKGYKINLKINFIFFKDTF